MCSLLLLEMIFQLKNIQWYKLTIFFRVLILRKNHPESWKNFSVLEHHLEDRKDCSIMKSNKDRVWTVLKHYVPDLLEGLGEKDILKICGILDSNSFRIDKYGSRGLFLATSMVNHDCQG